MGGHQSLVTWIEDTALCNAYKLSFHSPVPKEDRWTDQIAFRTEIVTRYFQIAKELSRKRKRVATSSVSPVTIIPLR